MTPSLWLGLYLWIGIGVALYRLLQVGFRVDAWPDLLQVLLFVGLVAVIWPIAALCFWYDREDM